MAGGLMVNPTQAIDGTPIKDGYTASCYDNESGVGITVIAWGPQHFKAFTEIVGNGDELRAGFAGNALVQAMCAFRLLTGVKDGKPS
jgi:hypothetical protein